MFGIFNDFLYVVKALSGGDEEFFLEFIGFLLLVWGFAIFSLSIFF